MTRPQTEAEYLARMVPPSVAATRFGRRALVKGALGAGLTVPLLAACGGDSSSEGSATSTTGGALSGTVTLGSNQSDAVPKASLKAVTDAFTAKTTVTVETNTVDHNTFQENINNYLQGKPDDVFTWFAGYRMRFFADQGLAGDVSDVWEGLTGYTEGFKSASTATDGKQYLVPFSYYPWAVFYRKSVFEAGGYTVPKTLEEMKALATDMKAKGLVPIAFADKDGWPAMGTFDILNMRVNGYDFHIDLMAGNKSWTSPEVKEVFTLWADLLPFHQADSLGRTWQEAAQSLQQKKAGMYLLGLFMTQQFPKEELGDVDFFTFPEVDSAIGADALDAPIDGFMMAPKPKAEANAKALLGYIGSKEGADVFVKADPTTLVANSEADVSAYTALQTKAAEVVGSAKNIAQFLDRDTRPDFASTVMIPELQNFIRDPANVDKILESIEAQKKSIFAS